MAGGFGLQLVLRSRPGLKPGGWEQLELVPAENSLCSSSCPTGLRGRRQAPHWSLKGNGLWKICHLQPS